MNKSYILICQPDISVPEQGLLVIPETAKIYIQDTSATIKLINEKYSHSKC